MVEIVPADVHPKAGRPAISARFPQPPLIRYLNDLNDHLSE
jgi:hypothetical protein